MKHLKKKVKHIVPVIAFTLFIANYHICEFFYHDNVKEWWHLKVDIYSTIIMLLFFYSRLFTVGKVRFVLDVFFGISASNVVDRFFFEVRDFRWNDILMIAMTLIFAFYKLKNANRVK